MALDPEVVAAKTEGVPGMSLRDGRLLHAFIQEAKPRRILELGFSHGVSTCYLAAAVEGKPGASIVTIDRQSAASLSPSIDDLLGRLGLAHPVRAVRARESYNWELMKLIEEQSSKGACEPLFDFVFIDGAHSWEVDGLAFFLAEKLLRPGGWLLFDDCEWTFGSSGSLKSTPFVAQMSEREKTEPQVALVVRLLVAQHPSFTNVSLRGNWAWAQKRGDAATAEPSPLGRIYRNQDLPARLGEHVQRLVHKIRLGS